MSRVWAVGELRGMVTNNVLRSMMDPIHRNGLDGVLAVVPTEAITSQQPFLSFTGRRLITVGALLLRIGFEVHYTIITLLATARRY